MSSDHVPANPVDARIDAALAELQQMISRRYPNATFVVTHGEDPEGVYLTPTVDVEDTEEVFDVIVDRLLELQIDDELPVYVIPVRPESRVTQAFRSQRRSRDGAGHGRLEALSLPR